jgi:tetratricopeptide (TPR) repeat protein
MTNTRQASQAEVQKIFVQANALRNELLLLGDPAGKLTRAEHEAAIGQLTEWIVADAKDDTALVARGLAHWQMGDALRARADFEQAEALHVPAAGKPREESKGTSRVAAISARAVLLADAEERKESGVLFDKALRVDDRDPFHFLLRGLASWKQGDYASAERYLKRHVELEPDEAEGRRLLALLYAACPKPGVRDGKQALIHARRACEIAGEKDWACLDALAAAHAEAGEYEDALRVIEEAKTLAVGEKLDVIERRWHRYSVNQPLRLEQGPLSDRE